MQVDDTPDDVGEAATVAWSTVAAFASAVDADLDKWLAARYRVGLTEFRALTFLGDLPARELRVSELAQRLGLNQSSATRLVSRLESKGFAYRDVCDDDGRGVYAVLDGDGEALLRDARGPFAQRVRDVLRDLPGHFPHLSAGAVDGALEDVRSLLKG
ncbi:MarR family winged helix-turn-helix transcriptional regulator [Corynebacterium kalidii]|jgi:DNA-binding MarR family transcriptional regulator|uniref:MarR family transcriptional regulator n=1 Tax=Corynebacterium kalidii TaxID=2931982 RepID=A0A9X1WFT1_9CORY|nr:MarR family transcriptional regulator [Corynebacterium kalidii]MCJ7858219.1 MarR family transcriptional regulator [Corynebacterium kalidii]